MGRKLEVHEKKYDILDANDNSLTFRINIDVLNEAFGVGRSMFAKACYPDKKHTYFCGTKQVDKFFIWMPKLYGNSSEWKNSISADGNTIYETAEPTKKNDWKDEDNGFLEGLRIVFVKQSPKDPYMFVGVFENGTIDYLKHDYKRIATKIKLIGNPVYGIELLDDNR